MRTGILCAGLVIPFLFSCSRELTKDEVALDRYREANEAFAQGNYLECIPHYEYVIKWRDRVFDAYLKLATCYDQVDRLTDAVAILHQLIRVDPTHIPGMRALARAHEKRGDLKAAIEMNQKILGRNSGDKEASNEILRLRQETGR